MKHFNPQHQIKPRILATDLDGTLIPLQQSRMNADCLTQLCNIHKKQHFSLIFATGRHFESVIPAVAEYELPAPEWIVCDVGTAIYKRIGDDYEHFVPYETHLSERTNGSNRTAVEMLLADIDGLEPQPPAHQQRFKISYQSDSDKVDALVQAINARLAEAALPYTCMGSIDPFQHCGLFDVLPREVSKAYALIWLATHADFTPDEVIYSGDSENDLAALTCGFRAIVVANASPGLAEKVRSTLAGRHQQDRLYHAKGEATSGVLEGCRHFGLFDE
jgi:HAD superfamily hydrolase (TIGR01484 family)